MNFIISINPDYKDIDLSTLQLRDIDRAELIKTMVAYGVQPVKVEGNESTISVFFLAEETEKFENNYLSNKPILIPLERWNYATEWWNNLMTLWNSKKRFLAHNK